MNAPRLSLDELREDNVRLEDLVSELQATQAELERSNGELERFAYVASHDLAEPLRAISAFTQRLADKYKGRLDSDADDYIEFILDGTERMRQLIQALLVYSRVGREELRPEWIDSGELVRTTMASLGIEPDDPRVVVAGDLPRVHGDRTLLAQVFQNLVVNGLKFVGDDEPRVEIAATRESNRWQFTVADNGIGIAPRHAERVFEVFERLHTREHFDGAGIGLSVCRRVVERHGGQIWIAPDSERGSTFCFTLPAKEET